MGHNFTEWVRTLEDRIAAAKSRLDENSNPTADDRSKFEAFEQRYAELRKAAMENDGEAEVSAPAAQTTLLDELEAWVSDLDRRYNRPARRMPNVSM